MVKLARKSSQGTPLRTFSLAYLKNDAQNVSKEHDKTSLNKQNTGKKVETKKFRSTSNLENPIRPISKSGLKLHLNYLKKDQGKKLNLKIETPTAKKN